MIHWFKLMMAAALILAAAACQRVVPQTVDPSLNETNSAKLYIYRTNRSFHSLNPEQPYVYLDDESIGTLGTGDMLYRQVAAGQHRISIRKPILFMPAQQTGQISVDLTPGQTYYVRYTHDFSGAYGTIIQSTHMLQLVDEAAYQQRR